jgi:hypothetical protein
VRRHERIPSIAAIIIIITTTTTTTTVIVTTTATAPTTGATDSKRCRHCFAAASGTVGHFLQLRNARAGGHVK